MPEDKPVDQPEDGSKVYMDDDGLNLWTVYDRQIDQRTANYNPLGGTSERACANCQWFIAPGGCVVVQSHPDPIVPNGLSDEWKLRVRPETSLDPLPVVIIDAEEGESSLTIGEKQETKTEGGIDFRASDFAVVPESDKPSTWKLRLAEERSGNFTIAQVGRAITAMQPGGFRGNRVQLTGDQKSEAIRKIGAAIGKTGGTDDQKANLRERLDDVKEIEVRITVPRSFKNFVLSKLAAMTDAMRGLGVGGSEDTTPGQSFVTFKDTSGQWRWFSWTSNKFRDRDNPPEIFRDSAHKEYVAHVDKTGEFPELWFWHEPGTTWGKADWVDYADGFLMHSGTVDPKFSGVAEALSKQKNLGVSHGYHFLHSDPQNGIIGWYRTFEVSPLPMKAAANPWTGIAMLQKERGEMGFNTGKREEMVKLIGEDMVKRFEDNTTELVKELDRMGVEYKGKGFFDDVKDDEQTPPPDGIDYKALATEAAKALADTEAFKALGESMKTVGEEITGIKARLDALEKTDADKIAEKFRAKAGPNGQGHKASESDANVIEKDDPRAKEGPRYDWFGDVVEQIAAQVEQPT